MRKEEKNKNMAEANRLAEMEYQKGREAMGIPSKVNEEGEWHMSPSGKMTNMSPTDDDYEINYGAKAVKEEGYAEDDHGMGLEPGEEPIDENDDDHDDVYVIHIKEKKDGTPYYVVWDKLDGEEAATFDSKKEAEDWITSKKIYEELNEMKRISKQWLND